MLRRSVPLLFLLACCSLIGPAAASAQTTGATLLGTVFDEQGAVLPGATVTITNTETGFNRVVVSDERGYYRAAALPPGQYEMKVEMAGFSSQVRAGMSLTIGQEATINFTLKLSSVQEAITVTADSPLVETTKSTVGTTINRQQLDNLPIPGRNFTALANLTPGVTGVGGGGLNTGGQISRNNTFLIDGTSNDETALNSTRGSMSLETVREYVVMASQFNAEYGNASGAIVTVVTRSGTNTLQGRAFGFFRDTSLNARAFAAADLCAQAAAAGKECDPKPAFSQQRYGGTLGGPFVHDKLHYFGAYEGTRQRETSIISSRVTDAMLVAFNQPLTRTFPRNQDAHNVFYKVDNQLAANQTLTASYRLDHNRSKGNGIGGTSTRERGSDQINRSQDFRLTHTTVLSDRALNEARFAYSTHLRWTTVDGYFSPTGLTINRPDISLGKSSNNPQGDKERYIQIIDNFSYTAGPHNFKTGFSINLLRDNAYFLGNKDGTYTFETNLPFDPANPATYPVQYTQNIGDWFDPELDNVYGFFVQDSWRIRPTFTLNLGLRYDRETAWSKANVLRIADASTNYAPVPGEVADDTNNWQPRAGFAWDPFGDGKTAIRGGYGMYYDQTFLNITGNISVSTKARGVTIRNPGYPDPFSSGTEQASIPSATVASPEIEVPQTRSLSIGFTREIVNGLGVTVDFVNTRGRHLFNARDINWDSASASRINKSWQVVNRYETTGDSWSNALAVGVNKRSSGRIPGFSIAYTLSKAERNVEDFGSRAQDPNNLAAEKSLANNDRRHQIVTQVTWALPFGIQLGGLLQARTGNPVNITTGTDNNGDSNRNDRPDLVDPNGNPWNPATYNRNFTKRVGNLPRNYATGPGFIQVDLRVSKIVRLAGTRFELFGEAFNLTNLRNDNNPSSSLNSATFGKVTSWGSPREIEFGLRFDF
ncbi:MAG: TonB-dependent receptor domain-containing protein [Vicinamibacterales bacterium]